MTARNYDKFNYSAYNAGTTYTIGQQVQDANIVYESLQNGNTGNAPAASPSFWQVVNSFGQYLDELFRESASETVLEVMNRKKVRKETKTLLQNLRLTQGIGTYNDKIVNVGSLVGVEVKLRYNQNILAVINRIGLQFAADATFNIYIYHSSQIEPIFTQAVTYTGIGSFNWVELNAKLNYLTESYDAGGVFYVMYDQNDLAVQAVKKKHNFHLAPCGYCNKNEVNNFNIYSRYLQIRTVEVTSSNRNTDNDIYLWDITKTKYVPDNNFGLNFEFTVKCDLTEFIIQQKNVFEYAYRDMLINRMLEQIANSTRQNNNEEKVSLKARAELQDKKVAGLGFSERLEKQLEAVDFELSRLDDVCMPCNDPGLQYKSAGLNG
jgi:hypothetical protein